MTDRSKVQNLLRRGAQLVTDKDRVFESHGVTDYNGDGDTDDVVSYLYDLESGELIWEGPGLTTNPIPSPVAAGGSGLCWTTACSPDDTVPSGSTHCTARSQSAWVRLRIFP